MARLLRSVLFTLFFVTVGWACGVVFGVPGVVRTAAESAFGKDVFAPDNLERAKSQSEDTLHTLEEATGDFFARFGEDLDAIYQSADESSGDAPSDLDIPDSSGSGAEQTDAAAFVEPAVVLNAADELQICATTVSNAPQRDADGNVANFSPTVSMRGVSLLVAPVTKACLSSGFGLRGTGGRLHKGVDYYSDQGGEVLAAADGLILEATYRDDYGYMLVIDHGGGVYTRSAHLKRFAEGIDAGVRVAQGQVLGPIGNSGAYTKVVHLHYEVLTGDYDNPKRSFGLQPVNVFNP